MASIDEIAQGYVNQINESPDKLQALHDVFDKIDLLKYENGNLVDDSDKEKILDKIFDLILPKSPKEQAAYSTSKPSSKLSFGRNQEICKLVSKTITTLSKAQVQPDQIRAAINKGAEEMANRANIPSQIPLFEESANSFFTLIKRLIEKKP